MSTVSRSFPPTSTAPSSDLSSGSIASMVRALSVGSQPSQALRDHSNAILRLSRSRGRAECEALGLVFEDESVADDDRRVLILDLLARAGTPEAQIVMRHVLSLAIARRSRRTFATFVQRLGFLERPDGATLHFLMAVYRNSRHEPHEIRSAHAYALAAAAGRAHVWGMVEAAHQASELLRRDLLAESDDVTEKCSLLTALGNAGLETDVPLILRFTTDPEQRVRVAATLALRKMHTREARSHLLSMIAGAGAVAASNGEPAVAQAALSALFGQTLAGEDIVRLTQLVLAGRTALALDTRILRLIVTQKRAMPSAQLPTEEVDQAIHLLLARIEGSLASAPSLLMHAPPQPPQSAHRVDVDDDDDDDDDELDLAVDESGEFARGSATRLPTTHRKTQPSMDRVMDRVVGSDVASGDRTKSAFALATPIKPLAVIR